MDDSGKRLTTTMEDYLEGIYLLSQDRRVVRMRDIAGLFGVSPSSATTTVQLLVRRGLLSHEKYEDVVLTGRGREIAEMVLRRHLELRSFLQDVLLLDPETAEEDACRLEHGISETTLERLQAFAATIRGCGNSGTGCMRAFRRFVADAVPKAEAPCSLPQPDSMETAQP
jgi:DtxR family Mn-dependent transcriptional regulator